MTDVLPNPSTDLNTQEDHQEIQPQSSHHEEKPSHDQPDQQVPQENNQENSSKKAEPEQVIEQIILIEKKEITVEFVPQTQPVLQEAHNRAEYQTLRRSQDPKEVSGELYGLHAKVDKILGKYKTSNIPVYPTSTAQPGHSSVENLLKNSSYLHNLNRAPSTETILRTSTYQNIQERSKSRGRAESPTRSPTKSVRFADEYNFAAKPSVYQSQISNNLSLSPVRTRETREERPLKFSGYSSTVNTNVDLDHKPLYDTNKLDEIINRINGTPAPTGQNLRASKAFDVSPAIQKSSPLFDNYQSQMPQYVTVESRFEMEPLTSHGSLANGAQNQQKMTSLVNSIDNLALKFGEKNEKEKEEQVEKTPEQLYAEHAQQFFENEENLRDFDFSKYKRI